MKKLLIMAIMLLIAAGSPAFGQNNQRHAMCLQQCPPEQNWQECYNRLVSEMTTTVPENYWGPVYDSILICIGENISSRTLVSFSGKGWAVFETKGPCQIGNLFPYELGDNLHLREAVPGELYAFLDSRPYGVLTFILKKTDNDVAVSNLAKFDTVAAALYGMGSPAATAQVDAIRGWEQLQMHQLTTLYENNDLPDTLHTMWEKRYGLNFVMTASPEERHRDGVLPLESTLFTDCHGLQKGMVGLGGWSMFRFPNSKFVHFFYFEDNSSK
jgi:hypothetical protein